MAKEPKGPEGGQLTTTSRVLMEFAEVLKVYLEQFGWPGTLVLAGIALLFVWGTADQKRRLIEFIFLSAWTPTTWRQVILFGLFFLILFAQRWFYLRQIDILRAEVSREAQEKSELQERMAGRKLEHGDNRSKSRGKK